MADNTTAPAPRKRFRWLRILLWSALALVVLLVIAFFVVTSDAFFRGSILPKVSQAMNAKISVDKASIHLSSVDLRNLKIQTTGPEPLVSAQEVRLRYSLGDIIGGRITVEEVLVQSPTIEIIEYPDGTTNLDPLTKKEAKAGTGQPTKPTRPAQPEKPSKAPELGAPAEKGKPMEVNLKKIDILNATVRTIKNYTGGYKEVMTVSGFNFSARNIANCQTGKITISSGLSLENNPPPPATNSSLLAKIGGEFSFLLARDLNLESIQGTLGFDVEKAAGGLSEAAGFSTALNCDATPTEIKELALRFKKSGATLGELLVNGPFSIAQREGVLKVQLFGLDRQVLNLAGAKTGMDFGQTRISSTNQIAITNQGKVIALAGQLNANQFSVTRANQSTPPLDFTTSYGVTVDQAAQSATIKEFNLRGVQNQRQLLSGELSNPMKVAWGSNPAPAGDATLNFKIIGLDLADWKAFVGAIAPAGKIDLATTLFSQQGGNLLTLDLSSQVEGLTAVLGSNQVSQLGATLLTKAQVTNLKKVVLNDLRAQLTQQGQRLVTATASGTIDNQTTNTDLNVMVQAALPRLAQIVPQTNLTVTAGNVDLKAHVTQKQAAQSVTGKFALTDFTGKMGASEFANYAVATDFEVTRDDRLIKARKTGVLQSGGKPGGTFESTGSVELAGGSEKGLKAAQVSLKLADLNENALRPFLQGALGDKKLVSVLVNSTANVNYNPRSDSDIKANFQMTKLVVNDPKKQIPETPLEAKLQLDTGLAKQVLDLRKITITLTPTERGKNEVSLAGKVDMSDAKATQGNLKLLADSLDLTTYYELFGGGKSEKPAGAAAKPSGTASAPAPTAKAAPAQPAPVAEAPASTTTAAKPLPFRNFNLEASIGRIYLRQIEITNLHTLLKLDANRLLLQPLQLTFNGAPLKSSVDLDLGVPGYKYDVAFSADKLPLKPLVDSFMPERKGMIGGEIISDVKLQGVGTTGASLQKTLDGQVQFALTNANLDILDPLFQKYLGPLAKFLQPIATFLNVPELVKSPIQQVNLNSRMGQGKIQVNTLNVLSPAFTLDTTGTMPIADVLTNSPFQNWPVNFYLSRNLAQKIGFASTNTPADAKYAKLPNFLSVAGTLGSPDPHINKIALAGTLLEKYLPKIPGVGEKGGSLLQGLGGILGTQGASTNQPSATKTNTGIGSILGGLLGGKQPATTNPPASGTNQPRKINPFDLFKK